MAEIGKIARTKPLKVAFNRRLSYSKWLKKKVFNLGASVYDQLTTQHYWKSSVQCLTQHFQSPQQNIRILDLGCGAGVSSFVLAEWSGKADVVGIDIAHKMIEKAQCHHSTNYPDLTNVRFMEADATKLPFAAETFDIAIGHSFLYLIPQKLEVLQEVKRVLKKGGQLILMEPYSDGSLVNTLCQRTDYLTKIWNKPGSTLRFIASIVAWRLLSLIEGRISSKFVHRIFADAGYGQISTVPTLNQLGLYCIGFS